MGGRDILRVVRKARPVGRGREFQDVQRDRVQPVRRNDVTRERLPGVRIDNRRRDAGRDRSECLAGRSAVGTVVVLVPGTTLRKPSYPTKKNVLSRMMGPPSVAPNRFDRVLGRTSAKGFLASSAEFRRYS